MLLFEPVLLSILKNKKRKDGNGVLGEPPELRIACFSLNLLSLCAFMLFPLRLV